MIRLFSISILLLGALIKPDLAKSFTCYQILRHSSQVTTLSPVNTGVDTSGFAEIPMYELYHRLFFGKQPFGHLQSLEVNPKYSREPETNDPYAQIFFDKNQSGFTRAVSRELMGAKGDHVKITQSEFFIPTDTPTGVKNVGSLQAHNGFKLGIILTRSLSDGTQYLQGYDTIALNGVAYRQQKLSLKLSRGEKLLKEVRLIDDDLRARLENDAPHLSVKIPGNTNSENGIDSMTVRIALSKFPGTVINWISHREHDEIRLHVHAVVDKQVQTYLVTIGKQNMREAYYPTPKTAIITTKNSTVQIEQIGTSLSSNELKMFGLLATHREFFASYEDAKPETPKTAKPKPNTTKNTPILSRP